MGGKPETCIEYACVELHERLKSQNNYKYTLPNIERTEIVIWGESPYDNIDFPANFQGYKVRYPYRNESMTCSAPYSTGTGLLGQVGWVGNHNRHYEFVRIKYEADLFWWVITRFFIPIIILILVLIIIGAINMGIVQHDIVVATNYDEKHLEKLRAQDFFDPTFFLISKPKMNGVYTVCLISDGSKEGWPEDDAGDKRRLDFMNWMDMCAFEDGSNSWCYAEVSMGEHGTFLVSYNHND